MLKDVAAATGVYDVCVSGDGEKDTCVSVEWEKDVFEIDDTEGMEERPKDCREDDCD